MAYELLIPFVLATLTFMVTPGPGSLYCGAQSLAYGTRAGLRAALGLHMGGYVHVFAASAGLAIILETIPLAFTIMKILGAGILIWMGLSFLFARRSGADAPVAAGSESTFWKAFAVEALNPTTALFFLAFLPQFVSPEAAMPVWAQFLVLGTVTGAIFSISDLAYALAGGRIHAAARASSRLRAWAKRAGGALLVGLGLNLALNRST
ncbi:MAG: LysE family translocator [Pseudomonadota bacterium]